jgi:hypothetical protein
VKYLIAILVIAGAVLIFAPPMMYPDLTQMQLLIAHWKSYLAAIICLVAAVLLMRMEPDT